MIDKSRYCPEGYFCPEGTHGFFNQASKKLEAKIDQSDVNLVSMQKDHKAVKCPTGYFCPKGTRIDPRVSYAHDFQDKESDTPFSYYISMQDIITAVRQGAVCPTQVNASGDPNTREKCDPILPLEDKDHGDNKGNNLELRCAKGYFCPEASIDQFGRLLGEESDPNNDQDKRMCPRGFYCNRGTKAADKKVNISSKKLR